MSGRYRTVVLQAISVAVLAAVVFVAFLRPSEPGDLSGIEAPGGDDGEAIMDDPPDRKKDKDKKKGNKDRDRQKKGDRRSNGSRTVGNDERSGPVGGSAAQGGATADDVVFAPPTDGGGPDDDQYTDLVSALMRQVGQPMLFREIDNP